jgi:hypothetical protein
MGALRPNLYFSALSSTSPDGIGPDRVSFECSNAHEIELGKYEWESQGITETIRMNFPE